MTILLKRFSWIFYLNASLIYFWKLIYLFPCTLDLKPEIYFLIIEAENLWSFRNYCPSPQAYCLLSFTHLQYVWRIHCSTILMPNLPLQKVLLESVLILWCYVWTLTESKSSSIHVKEKILLKVKYTCFSSCQILKDTNAIITMTPLVCPYCDSS